MNWRSKYHFPSSLYKNKIIKKQKQNQDTKKYSVASDAQLMLTVLWYVKWKRNYKYFVWKAK